MRTEPAINIPPATTSELQLHVSPGPETRIAAVGDIDSATGDQLRRTVLDLVAGQRPQDIDVDLAGVPFLDSAGIRTLLVCRACAHEAGSEFRLTNAVPMVRRVLQVTGLLEHFALAPRTVPATGRGPAGHSMGEAGDPRQEAVQLRHAARQARKRAREMRVDDAARRSRMRVAVAKSDATSRPSPPANPPPRAQRHRPS